MKRTDLFIKGNKKVKRKPITYYLDKKEEIIILNLGIPEIIPPSKKKKLFNIYLLNTESI